MKLIWMVYLIFAACFVLTIQAIAVSEPKETFLASCVYKNKPMQCVVIEGEGVYFDGVLVPLDKITNVVTTDDVVAIYLKDD